MNIQRIYFLYLSPEGRIGRLTMVAGLAALLLAGAAVHLTVPMSGPAWFFFDCFLFMFALVLAVKRLFDRGRPDWFVFSGLTTAADPMTRKVHDSFMSFKKKHDKWANSSNRQFAIRVRGG